MRPCAIDEEGLGHAVDAVVDRDLARRIGRVGEGEPEVVDEFPRRPRPCPGCRRPRRRRRGRDRSPATLEGRRLLVAGGIAPRGPEVEDDDLAAQRLEAERRALERGEREGRRRPADQRRGNVARVQRESRRRAAPAPAPPPAGSASARARSHAGSCAPLRQDGQQRAEREDEAADPDPGDHAVDLELHRWRASRRGRSRPAPGRRRPSGRGDSRRRRSATAPADRTSWPGAARCRPAPVRDREASPITLTWLDSSPSARPSKRSGSRPAPPPRRA